jgi:hypothetical protein
MNCPHCNGTGVHVNPRNCNMFFCQDCALPSLQEDNFLRPIFKSDLKESVISGKDRYAAFIWMVKVLTEKLTHKPKGAGART